jgi:hypothetical protein
MSRQITPTDMTVMLLLSLYTSPQVVKATTKGRPGKVILAINSSIPSWSPTAHTCSQTHTYSTHVTQAHNGMCIQTCNGLTRAHSTHTHLHNINVHT